MANLEIVRSIFQELRERKKTVTCAESCTGGLLQGALTDLPGISEVFRGGVVTYSNEGKERLLGVPGGVLREHGAVSRECALAMAQGVLRLFGADYAVSVTGVAGPDGGTPDKPVGGVWFGLTDGKESRAVHSLFPGGRAEVREAAVHFALSELLRLIQSR